MSTFFQSFLSQNDFVAPMMFCFLVFSSYKVTRKHSHKKFKYCVIPSIMFKFVSNYYVVIEVDKILIALNKIKRANYFYN